MDLFNSEEVIAKPEIQAFENKDDHKPDLASFLSDAKLIDQELLAATIGPLLYPNILIWDVIIQKAKFLNEDSLALSSFDLIQTILNEVEQIFNEVKALVNGCCEVINDEYQVKVEEIIPLSRCMSKILSTQNSRLCLKEINEIPKYYIDLLFPQELKTEPLDDYPENDLEDTNTITDFNEKETDKEQYKEETAAAGTSTKRKYTRIKPLRGKAKRARKANLKNIPPELKLTEAENAGVVESQRRRRCQVCTKSFQHQKKLSDHLSNPGECPGKPNPKWHYFNYITKKLYCIHPDCLGPNGTFNIDNHQSSFKCSGMSKDYLNHVLEKHTTPETERFPCDSCQLKFPNLYILKYHKDKCGENFPCKYCGRGYKNRRVLQLHEASHLARKEFNCHICDYSASRKDLLKAHIKGVHDNERNEICPLCGKRFLTKTKLEKHILTHSDKKLYSCEKCGTKLKNYSCVRSHMMNVHGEKISCDICQKDFFKSEGLRRHRMSEHGIEIFDN